MAEVSKQIEALTAAINSLLQFQVQNEKSKLESQTSPQGAVTDLYNQLSARVEKYSYGLGDEIKPFTKWLQRHEYTIVHEAASLPIEMRTRLILDKLGQTEYDRLVDHVAPTEPAKILQPDLIKHLENLFRDRTSITRRRIEILNFRYSKAVPIVEHIDRINRHASEFERAKLSDNGLRVLLLLQSFCFSQENNELKKIALRVVEKDKDATLKTIATELEAHLNVSSNMKTLENPVSSTPTVVNAVRSNQGSATQRGDVQKKKPTSSTKSLSQTHVSTKCYGCGGAHLRTNCKFRDATCNKCSKKGHIAKVCRSGESVSKEAPKCTSKDAAKNANLAIQSITSIDKRRRIYVTTSILGKSVRLQYDSGSDVTTVGKKEWAHLGRPKLTTSDTVQHAGGSELRTIGKFRAAIQAFDRVGEIDVNVVSRDRVNLFGLNAIDKLNLWSVPLSQCRESLTTLSVQHSAPNVTPTPLTSVSESRENLLKSFPKLFARDLGKCVDFQARLALTENARPVQR